MCNGRGSYVISKIDDYDHGKTAENLLKEIQKWEKSLKDTGFSLDQIAKKYNVSL